MLPGLTAPSGVVFAGAMLTLRDAIHERVGTWRTVVVLLLSAPVLALLSTPGLAFASCATFLAAELSDLAVFRPLRSAGFYRAAVASNVVSSVIDSALFLGLAYGAHAAASGTFGLVVGKVLASSAALLAVRILSGIRGYVRTTADAGPNNSPSGRGELSRAPPGRCRPRTPEATHASSVRTAHECEDSRSGDKPRGGNRNPASVLEPLSLKRAGLGRAQCLRVRQESPNIRDRGSCHLGPPRRCIARRRTTTASSVADVEGPHMTSTMGNWGRRSSRVERNSLLTATYGVRWPRTTRCPMAPPCRTGHT